MEIRENVRNMTVYISLSDLNWRSKRKIKKAMPVFWRRRNEFKNFKIIEVAREFAQE